MNANEKWEKLSVELPPGWHEAMQSVAKLTGDVPLKYLYAVAIDQFLSGSDLAAITDAAWEMHRQSKTNLPEISSRYDAKELEKRLKARRRS